MKTKDTRGEAKPALRLEGGREGRELVISGYDLMPPFLMSLASDSDLWLFLSSTGALTAGRKDPDHALFPYTTDDRIHDSAGQVGPVTLVRATRGKTAHEWEPLSSGREKACSGAGGPKVRELRKTATCDRVTFLERDEALGLEFSYSWTASGAHGLVREARLRNLAGSPVSIELLDGLLGLMPAELTRRFQAEYSTLADAYRECELLRAAPAPGPDVRGTPLALLRLSSIPADRAEPNEALRANTVWSHGLEPDAVYLLEKAIDAFRRGERPEESRRERGRRGAYLARAAFTLAPGEERSWIMVLDTGADAVRVRNLLASLSPEGGARLAREVLEDTRASAESLKSLVASVDGIQSSADELRCFRHYANALSNAMRGGLPADGYSVRREDFAAYLHAVSRQAGTRHASFLASLPEVLGRGALVASARATGDRDLERLAREYLPLTFSRRHGDPSRPWNIFSIATKDASGRRVLGYEGNWRDIFQNWEALALSYPGWLDSMVFKFLDSSTADGWNPYRVTMTGCDWEVVDPHDDWSFIGYWGDHQAAYLLRLLESSERHFPGALARDLDRDLFTYARVPYRIRPYESMLKTPKATVDFDAGLHALVRERGRSMGTEGLLLHDHEGKPVRASLAEKLLVTVLARLTNLVPGAGIWMNTQRPEWNDANNALVGNGASVVTLCQLRRLLCLVRGLIASAGGSGGASGLALHAEVGRLLAAVSTALAADPARAACDPAARRAFMDCLGEAGSAYRAALYEKGFSGAMEEVGRPAILALLDRALAHVEEGIRVNRREDGLFHAYNLISWEGGPVTLRRLPLMLEGQVAILSSGLLGPAEAASLLEALRASALWREDQSSYLLYPDRTLPSFLERNNLDPEKASRSRLVAVLLAEGDTSIVVRDAEGGLHFSADLHNARCLELALDRLAGSAHAALAKEERRLLLDLYEGVFDHHSFTGRSGSFYKYEGLGSIYWHMVSKLLLAAGEALIAAEEEGAETDAEREAALERLRTAYRELREGIGAHKDPSVYGAFPTDPYSHTPSFAGAQQPGLTGQVKEDLISRSGELGVRVVDGRLRFHPSFAAFEELRADGSYGFSLCGLPVTVHAGSGSPARAGGPGWIEALDSEGKAHRIEGLELDEALSSSIFLREGRLTRLDVFMPAHLPSSQSRTGNGQPH